MAKLTHAKDPDFALRGSYRVLKPGGHLVLHEYEHDVEDDECHAWKVMFKLGTLLIHL